MILLSFALFRCQYWRSRRVPRRVRIVDPTKFSNTPVAPVTESVNGESEFRRFGGAKVNVRMLQAYLANSSSLTLDIPFRNSLFQF